MPHTLILFFVFSAIINHNDTLALTIPDAGVSLTGPASIFNGQEALYVVTISGTGATISNETELSLSIIDDQPGNSNDFELVGSRAFFVIGSGADGSFTNTEIFTLNCNSRYDLSITNNVSSDEGVSHDPAEVYVVVKTSTGEHMSRSPEMIVTCAPNRQQQELMDAIGTLEACIAGWGSSPEFRKTILIPAKRIAEKALHELTKEPPNNPAALKGIKNLASTLRDANTSDPSQTKACELESLMRGLLFKVSRTLASDAIREGAASGCKECKINSANVLMLQGVKHAKLGKSFAAADCFLKAFTRVK
jgi:hypothetical protein